MEEETGALPAKNDFSSWFNEVLWRAEVMDVRYPVKGLYVWFPHGFAIRKHVYERLREIMDRDHQETLFPLLIPEYEFMKEAEHIKGFEEEVYWVTHGGKNQLDVPLALRPTSETAIYPMYALWVRSHADLPLKMYQVVNTFRYETKHTRPLIRLREITSFKEAHTVHATWEEAESQVRAAIEWYIEFYIGLCVPVIVSRRPDWDKFPGADYTVAVDTIMPDGRALQIGTVHHLGDHFSQTFGITYEDDKGVQRYAQQTCYGISERCIAALLSLHGDDHGLVLPSSVAPVQVVIVPILIGKRRAEVNAAAEMMEQVLRAAGIRVKRDIREIRPGAKYYHWEMRGVPIRLEVGPRDIDAGVVSAVTRTGERSTIPRGDLVPGVQALLGQVTASIKKRATDEIRSRITVAGNVDDVVLAVQKGIAVVPWCGERRCAELLEEKSGGSILGMYVRSELVEGIDGVCPVCGQKGCCTLIGRTF